MSSIGVWQCPTFARVIRTIIGAGSFHGPVRDGKAWDQTAMAAKLKLYKSSSRRYCYRPINLYPDPTCFRLSPSGNVYLFPVSFILLSVLPGVSTPQSTSNDRVKPHEQLVWVSCTRCRASTPHLSTSWSRTTLQEGLTPREVSSPGRFRA